MNDENRELGTDEVLPTPEDDAAALVNTLQDQVDSLEAQLAEAQAKVAELEANPREVVVEREVGTAAPAGDEELRALAATIRRAQLAGHPDAPKHVDALLRALGA